MEGVDDVMLRLAKCCRPVPGDPIVGYISLGRGITIHRQDCPNSQLLRKNPERFTDVYWEGEQTTAFIVEIQVDAWDRHRLLEDLSRVFSSPARTSWKRVACQIPRWSRTASWWR